VKTCKKCGETKALELFRKSNRYKCGYYARCLDCLNDYSNKWRKAARKKHPEKYKTTERKLEWQRMSRLMNPERYIAYSKTHYTKYREVLIANHSRWVKANREYVVEKQKVYNRKRVDTLQDLYVKNLIKGKGKLPIDNIPDVLVEAKRLEILIKRRVKDADN